jgi:hypothetical protein
MDLKNFIKQVGSSIVEATTELSNELNREITLKHKDNENIEFDVAVTIENHEANAANGSINILKTVTGQADIKNEYKNSTVSRIRFSLFVNPLTTKEENERLVKHDQLTNSR